MYNTYIDVFMKSIIHSSCHMATIPWQMTSICCFCLMSKLHSSIFLEGSESQWRCTAVNVLTSSKTRHWNLKRSPKIDGEHRPYSTICSWRKRSKTGGFVQALFRAGSGGFQPTDLAAKFESRRFLFRRFLRYAQLLLCVQSITV